MAPKVESPYDRPGQWYVVHTYAGYEQKVRGNLENRIASMNMEDRIYECVIPMEDVVEFKNGKKVTVSKEGLPRLPDGPHGPRRRLLVCCSQHAGCHRLCWHWRQAHSAVSQRSREHPAGQGRRPGHRGRSQGPQQASFRIRNWRKRARQGRPVCRLLRRDLRDQRRPSSRSRCWSTSSVARPRWSSTFARSRSSK